MKKIRILQFPIANSKGGITQYVLQNWKFINKIFFQFDFATMSKSLDYAEELEKSGCKIHYISCYAEENKEKFITEFKQVLVEGNYDIVHLHTKQWKSFLVEQVAKEVGVKKIIIHAHSTGIDTPDENKRQVEIELHNQVLEQLTEDIATDFWSCSWNAAQFIFSNRIPRSKIKIMNNAIDLSRYKFDAKVRAEDRDKLGIADEEYVIGHIGRLVYPKNQEFLITVFKKLSERRELKERKCKLLLVGAGEREDELKQMVSEYDLKDKVIFTGYRQDIPQLLQVMDVFCLPSLFEGFPISLIEAQAARLTCIASNNITREVDISGDVYYRKLEVNLWVDSLLLLMNKNKKRDDVCKTLLRNCFDINEQIKVMEEEYARDLV